MPVSRSVWNYPEPIWLTCEAVALRGEIQELDIESAKQGASIRGRFYGFKKALKHEAAKLDLLQERFERERAANPQAVEPHQLRDAKNLRVRELARRIDKVSCWLDAEKLKVQIMPLELSPIGQQFARFRKVGDAALSPQEQQGLDEIAQRLLREQQARDDVLPPTKTERDYG